MTDDQYSAFKLPKIKKNKKLYKFLSYMHDISWKFVC